MSQFHEWKDPLSTGLPGDLVTIREAEERCGVDGQTIRLWIRNGKGAKKLPTYRRPGMAEIMLVSQGAVMEWKRASTRQPRRSLAGRMGISLDEADAASLRKLALMMSNRIGIPIHYAEAFRQAINAAIRLESLRAEKSSAEGRQ